MRFVYAYFMKDEPERVQAIAPLHAAYWHDLHLRDYRGGRFADRSGGLITFAAEDGFQAQRLVEADPFVLERVIGDSWLKEWAVGNRSDTGNRGPSRRRGAASSSSAYASNNALLPQSGEASFPEAASVIADASRCSP